MDIADLTQTASAGALRRATAASAEAVPRIEAPTDTIKSDIRALDALRVELRATLTARFSAGFGNTASAFTPFAPKASAEDVAGETVQTARQVADARPGRAGRALIAFKASVSETIETLRETFSGRRDARDLDDVGRLVNRGIDGLVGERAGNAVSSTRVLEVDSKVRERAAIRIRTQEGDVVTIRMRNVERMAASDTVFSSAEGEATRTSVSTSQSRRASFSVDGDLNDAERAAIEDVMAQASEIAEAFFDGDLSVAFENAADFDFEASQLKRVNLRFRFDEVTRLRYGEAIVRGPEPTKAAPTTNPVSPADRPGIELGPIINRPAPVSAPSPVEPSAPVQPVEPAAGIDAPEASADAAAADPVAEPETPAPSVNADALNRFFTLVADFLERSNVAFEVEEGESRFFFSESFRLTLLRETLVTAAPEDKEGVAETAAGAVDKLVDATATAEREDDRDDD